MTDFTGKTGSAEIGAFSIDDDYLYFDWVDDQGDIWVMDVVKDEEK